MHERARQILHLCTTHINFEVMTTVVSTDFAEFPSHPCLDQLTGEKKVTKKTVTRISFKRVWHIQNSQKQKVLNLAFLENSQNSRQKPPKSSFDLILSRL